MGCLCHHFSQHHKQHTPTHLVEWWDSCPSSALKDYVLFLITMVMGTGSVELFFSFAKYKMCCGLLVSMEHQRFIACMGPPRN